MGTAWQAPPGARPNRDGAPWCSRQGRAVAGPSRPGRSREPSSNGRSRGMAAASAHRLTPFGRRHRTRLTGRLVPSFPIEFKYLEPGGRRSGASWQASHSRRQLRDATLTPATASSLYVLWIICHSKLNPVGPPVLTLKCHWVSLRPNSSHVNPNLRVEAGRDRGAVRLAVRRGGGSGVSLDVRETAGR